MLWLWCIWFVSFFDGMVAQSTFDLKKKKQGKKEKAAKSEL